MTDPTKPRPAPLPDPKETKSMSSKLEGDSVIPERDELFVCYHCKAGRCHFCVGVPCSCDCPDPRKAGEMVCCFKGCEARGVPQKGFDFFMCESCGDVLAILIEQKARLM